MPKFMNLPSLLTGAESTVSATDWAPIIESITGQISVQTVVATVASVVGGGIGLVFMWWGVRKAARTLMNAFRSGKLKF